MNSSNNYNELNLDDLMATGRQQATNVQPTEPAPVQGMTDATKTRIMHRLQFINVDDLRALIQWITPEELRNLHQECGSPDIKSIQYLNHGEAWDLQRAGWLALLKARNIEPCSRDDIWLLNNLDKKYVGWCPHIWGGMSYRQRLNWLSNVEAKRRRGITPHLVLMDIVDPHGYWKRHDDSGADGGDEGYDRGNNSIFC